MSKSVSFEANLINDHKFSNLVSEYALKLYKYNEAHEEDKDLRLQSMSYTFTQLKTYCLRFLSIHSSTCDNELHNAFIAWFNLNIFSKNQKFFEEYEQHRNNKSFIGNYVGPVPKVPKSELASGYTFDSGIQKE